MKTLLLSLLLLAGCSLNTARESLTVNVPATADRPPVTLQWKSEVTQLLWWYFTKTKAVEHATPFSSTCVGSIESEPNGIEAATESALPMLIKLLK